LRNPSKEVEQEASKQQAALDAEKRRKEADETAKRQALLDLEKRRKAENRAGTRAPLR